MQSNYLRFPVGGRKIAGYVGRRASPGDVGLSFPFTEDFQDFFESPGTLINSEDFSDGFPGDVDTLIVTDPFDDLADWDTGLATNFNIISDPSGEFGGDVLQFTNPSGGLAYRTDISKTNVVVEVDMNIVSSAHASYIGLRIDDTVGPTEGDGYWLGLAATGGANTRLRIYKRVNGVLTQLVLPSSTNSETYSGGQGIWKLKAGILGSHMYVTHIREAVSGVEPFWAVNTVSINDLTFVGAGTVGIGPLGGNVNTIFNDYKVSEIDAEQ